MFLWILGITSWVVSIFCLYNLWRKRVSTWKKLFWSVVLRPPILGPIAYGALFNPPAELSADMKAPEYDQTRHGLGDNYDSPPPGHRH